MTLKRSNADSGVIYPFLKGEVLLQIEPFKECMYLGIFKTLSESF